MKKFMKPSCAGMRFISTLTLLFFFYSQTFLLADFPQKDSFNAPADPPAVSAAEAKPMPAGLPPAVDPTFAFLEKEISLTAIEEKNQPDVYSVIAINVDGSSSFAITLTFP